MHIGKVESMQVLCVVDVLTVSWEMICLIHREAVMSSGDDFACIAKVTATMIPIPWRA